MADTAVTERRIRPILDAIHAGNWKQALKDCEKWQKKGEASDRFLALKAAVLMRQPDEKQQDKGTKETLELCHRTPPVLNFEAIHQLQESLGLMGLADVEGPKLWERAAGARPTDEGLITTWLNSTISSSDWQGAQKATMALKKAFPKERKYDFWNILMCYLISQDQKLPEKDKKLFGTLANRMISKAAQPGLGTKGISNIEELSLLAAILHHTGSADELPNILNAEHLKVVNDQDPYAADSLLLQAVSASQDPLVADHVIKKMLPGEDMKDDVTDDDRVWSIFVKSSQGSPQAQLDQIDKILTKHPRHRQAHLARLDLLVAHAKDNEDSMTEFLQASQYYCELFGSKAFCFDDLILRLNSVGRHATEKFAHLTGAYSSKSATLPQRLLALKLSFYLLSNDVLTRNSIYAFVVKALQVYKEAEADLSTAPESALLAALGLLGFAAADRNNVDSFRASMILQTASAKYKDYFPLRVLLFQTQMILGQLHLTMDTFFNLNIKNLQWETLGYLIFTRISTLHPHQYGHGEDSLNPLGGLDTALTVFHNSERSLDKAVREGLKYGSYSNIIDTVSLRQRLQNSITRRLFVLEERKCQRALAVPITQKFEPYLRDADLQDFRDASFMPTYGVSDHKVADFLRCGIRPGMSWVRAMTMHECLMAYLMAEAASPNQEVVRYALNNLTKAKSMLAAQSSDLTDDETSAIATYGILASLTLQMASGTQSTVKSSELTACIKQQEAKEIPAQINGVDYPDWKYLHHQHIRFEVLQTVAQFAIIAQKKIKASKDKAGWATELQQTLDDIRPLVSEQASSIYQSARDLKQQLNAPGVLGKLVDVVLGRSEPGTKEDDNFSEVMIEIQDEASVEEYCGMMKESWEDALDGILNAKFKGVV